MTKKDYELIAEAIYSGLTKESTFGTHVIVHITSENMRVAKVAKTMSFLLRKDNPKFNEVKFYQACGMIDSWDGIVKSRLIDEI